MKINRPRDRCDFGEAQVRFECIEDTIGMVDVDVHIGDTLHPVGSLQLLDGHTDIVKNGEAGGAISSGMVKTTKGREHACIGLR